MLKTEKLFTLVIDLELMFSNLILFIKTFKSLNSLFGHNTFNHWSIFLIVRSKVSNILY